MIFQKESYREIGLTRPEFQSFGDGLAGLLPLHPFDKILVTCEQSGFAY